MSGVMDYWSILNTLVVMLALGLSEKSETPAPGLAMSVLRVAMGYNLLIPVLALVLLKSTAWFSADSYTAMTLCIAAAGGASAGAFVAQVKGSPVLAARLLVVLVGVSVLAIAIFSKIHWITLGSLSLSGLAAYLLVITLAPLLLGKFLRQRFPEVSGKWHPHVERAGSLLVVLLVVALAIQHGRDILMGPREPLLAAMTLVLIFLAPPLLEADPSLRRTVVLVTLIRNLTLVLSLLAVLPQATNLIPTVLAFGLFMYLMTGLLVWRWRATAQG